MHVQSQSIQSLMPVYLAGRDKKIDEIVKSFQALTLNIPVQSIVYSGLRGVGKTVFCNLHGRGN